MPSSPPPPPAHHHDKTDDDGWVHVTPSSRRRAARRQQADSKAASASKFSQRPRDESHQRRPEDIASEYRQVRSRWVKEDACEQLKRLVTKTGISTISRAVCLGIGTFDPPDGGWETKRRTFIQLIAFLIMVECLEDMSDSRIECVFQDPVFTLSDRQFIESLGHKAVETPQGFDIIHENTFVFGVHLYRPIYAKALGGSLPAIFVGTDLDVWDWVTLGQAQDDLASSKNVKYMEDSYTKQQFPQDSSTTAFTSTSLYWRPSDKTPVEPIKDSDIDDADTQQRPVQTAETTDLEKAPPDEEKPVDENSGS